MGCTRNVLEWYKRKTGVKVANGVYIRESSSDLIRGNELHVDLSKMEGFWDEECVELIRIPQKYLFTTKSIMEIMADSSEYPANVDWNTVNEEFKRYLKLFLNNPNMSDQINETIILVVCLFVVGNLSNVFEVPSKITYYLKAVLLNAHANTIETSIDLFKEYYPEMVPSSIENVLATCDEMSVTFTERYGPSKMTNVRELIAAIRTRCMDIPEEISPESDDFITNVTLVPLIDFANHSAFNNSYFDIDRETNDILLMTRTTIVPKDAKDFEVLLDYGEGSRIFHFAVTHGFVPRSIPEPHNEFWTFHLEDEFLRMFKVGNINLESFYKLLDIKPIIHVMNVRNEMSEEVLRPDLEHIPGSMVPYTFKQNWMIINVEQGLSELLTAFMCDSKNIEDSAWEYTEKLSDTLS